MNGLFLKTAGGELGLALVNEVRKVKEVIYLSLEKHLQVVFTNDQEETLETEIDPEFNRSLHNRKDIFIAHFSEDKPQEAPSDEYHVPLSF
jgi:hypothetical protein